MGWISCLTWKTDQILSLSPVHTRKRVKHTTRYDNDTEISLDLRQNLVF